MRYDRENLSEKLHEAVIGYAVVVLAIVCFILAMVVLTAIVRLLVGTS